MREVNAAPTKDCVAVLLPKIYGNFDWMVEVVLPGICCKGVLYVRARLAYDVEGIWPVEVFEVEIFDFASVIPDDEEVNFEIYPFSTLILLFIFLNSVSKFLTPLKYVFGVVRLMLP